MEHAAVNAAQKQKKTKPALKDQTELGHSVTTCHNFSGPATCPGDGFPPSTRLKMNQCIHHQPASSTIQ